MWTKLKDCRFKKEFGLCQTDMYDKINTINGFHLACNEKETGL